MVRKTLANNKNMQAAISKIKQLRYGSRAASAHGDELVNVMVYIPEKLSDAERSAIESLKDSPNMQPSETEKQRLFSKFRHIFE